MAPPVAVVITTYYRNESLPDAIESSLAQTHDPVEVVVVDDSGERHAEPIVERYDVTYLPHEENSGQVSGWESGLEASSGRYVQFLDDDDRLAESKLEKQAELLETSPSTGVAYSGLKHEDGRTENPQQSLRGDVLERALTLDFKPALTSTLLIERDLLDAISPLPDYEAGTDIPLRIELAQVTEFDFVDEPLVHRRREYGSKGDSLAAVEARWRVLEAYRDIYDSMPAEVRQRAIANAGRFQGRVYLEHNTWSWRAIRGFWQEVRATSTFELKPIARLAASVFGAPGIESAEALQRWFRKLE